MEAKRYVSWEEVDEFIDDVIEYYEDVPISGVYGIPKGGLILASILSNRMDIPMLMAPAKDCIIIDDIADSGETLLHYDRNSSGGGIKRGYHIVTMFYKETSSVEPEFYEYIKTGKWVIYPWERKKA